MKPTKTLASAGFACALAMSPLVMADDDDDSDSDSDEQAIPFDEAHVFFELNNTDGDLGIHALIDGGPWKRLTIEDPHDRKILNVYARGRLRRQGLTEIFFESAEPRFDELPPEQFFERFPEGTYDVEGRTLDGEELESETEITHAMPAPAAAMVNGMPMALQCDDEEPGFDAPTLTAPIVVSWPAVTTTHPSLGDPQGSPDISIVNYEVVVEADIEGPDGEEFLTVFSVVLPPGVTSMTVPDEFLSQTDEFKYEILAREESWNQTAVESCFLLDEGD